MSVTTYVMCLICNTELSKSVLAFSKAHKFCSYLWPCLCMCIYIYVCVYIYI